MVRYLISQTACWHPPVQGSGSWQVVLRALSALECVLQQGMTQSCGEVAVMFQSDPSLVTHALQSPQQVGAGQRVRAIYGLPSNGR